VIDAIGLRIVGCVRRRRDFWMPFVVVKLGSTPAMIGPDAWSIDARIFGR
jgi:hypothetical protein